MKLWENVEALLKTNVGMSNSVNVWIITCMGLYVRKTFQLSANLNFLL